MKIRGLSLLICSCIFVFSIPVLGYAVEVSPKISDREIIEGLANIRGDIKEVKADIRRLDDGQKNLEKQFEKRFDSVDKRFDSVDKRFDSVEKRFDMLQWMFGVFITASMVILGFIIRILWQMQKRQTMVETTLETQKDELAFIKGLIEKLFPPKGVL